MKHNYLFLPIYILLVVLTAGVDVHAIPVRDIADLRDITFWERTDGSGPSAFTYSIDSTQLTIQLTGPLSAGNSDFGGVPGHEFYDVFFSDENGDFNIDGEYLTIEGAYDIAFPNGGALNLSEISLNFSDKPVEYGSYVASYVALGDNSHAESVGFAIDGDIFTHTAMGNTIGQSELLRVTLGFESSSGTAPAVPEPSTFILLGIGLISAFAIRRGGKNREH